jgi:hypothetical protein
VYRRCCAGALFCSNFWLPLYPTLPTGWWVAPPPVVYPTLPCLVAVLPCALPLLLPCSGGCRLHKRYTVGGWVACCPPYRH